MHSGSNATPVAETGWVVGTASTGSEPYDAAYDLADQRMYVVNFGSDNITVLNGTAVNATINVPFYSFPDGIAYDPATGTIYAALYGSDRVAVIQNETIVANVTVDWSRSASPTTARTAASTSPTRAATT